MMNIRQSYTGPAPRLSGAAADLDVLRVARQLWSGRKVICVAAFACAFLAAIYCVFLAKPIYRATAILVLQASDDPLDENGSRGVAAVIDLPTMKTEVEIIQSRGIIHRLVNDLDLMRDAEFNPASEMSGVWRIFGRSVPDAQKAGETEAVIGNVQRAVSARVRRNTYLFEISATSQDRYKAALMANQLAEIYLDAQLSTKISAVQATMENLSDRVSATQQDLMAHEEAVANQKATMALTSSEELRAVNVRLADARTRLQETRARVRVASDDAKARLQAQVEALEASVQDLSQNLAAKGQALHTLQQLEREADAARVLYETLLSRLKTTSVLLGLQQSDARLLTPAVAGSHLSPRTPLVIVMFLLTGAFLGGAYVFVTQLSRVGFRAVEDLEDATNKAVLGRIPLLPVSERAHLAAYLAENPDAPMVEAIRDLRTSLLMSRIDEPPQLILVASALEGEGKTTQAVALAHSLAGLGKRVLLVEGDLRRRTLGNYIPQKVSKGGVVSVLMDQVALTEATQHEQQLGIDILPGEFSQTSAADIFASRRFETLLNEARSHYDTIVVDSPPVLLVPDAKILARYADAILFVVAWDKTARRHVADGLRQFEVVQRPVSGLVLTQIQSAEQVEYGYSYLAEQPSTSSRNISAVTDTKAV